MKNERHQIVLAWAEKTKLVPDEGFTRRDGNLFPKMRLDWEGKAAIWLRNGGPDDEETARIFAEKEGKLVVVFPQNEKDPLGKARAVAVSRASLSPENNHD